MRSSVEALQRALDVLDVTLGRIELGLLHWAEATRHGPFPNEPRRTLCVVTDDAARVLAEAEEQIEAWLCELDATWNRILDDARTEARSVVAKARIEAFEIIAVARADAAALAADGHNAASRTIADAEARAAALLAKAEDDSQALLSGSGKLASMQLAEAQSEVLKARTLAAESSATVAALAHAASAAATGRVQIADLAALGDAVTRLRSELSRVVDAAFDALPAVEATAAALQLEEPVSLEAPVPAAAPPKKVGMIRRLLRI